MTRAVQLSCEQCKQRKTKCDKHTPCSACRASGISCRPVERARLPRGRTGRAAATNSIRDKVARLEELVDSLEDEMQQVGPDTSEPGTGDSVDFQATSRSNVTENFTAPDFWLTLSNEVAGLREMLEDSDEQEECDSYQTTQTNSMKTTKSSSPHRFLFSHGQDATILPVPSSDIQSILIQTYRSRVDWMFKIVHWPSVSMILQRSNNSNPLACSPVQLALEYAIYFLAACALLDHEFEEYRLGDKTVFIKQYQHATENLLSQAGLLTSTNITLLQAFVIYIAAIRSSTSGAAAWTLLALAVRLAHACNLHIQQQDRCSALQLEERRRLWFGIGFLDTQTSFGRGTLPLLSHQDLKHPPKVVNDDEISNHEALPQPLYTFTDMSFSSLCHEGTICQKKLIDPNYGPWSKRLELVTAFEQSVSQQFSHFEFSPDIKQRYTALLAKSMPVTMQLLLRRPLFKSFTHAIPPHNNYNILDIGCKVLNTGLAKSNTPQFASLAWFKWPKWFALAVVLVELCICGPGPMFDDAYEVARNSFNDDAQSRADVDSGNLWKPIARLMDRVEKLRSLRDAEKRGNSLAQTNLNGIFESNNNGHDHTTSLNPNTDVYHILSKETHASTNLNLFFTDIPYPTSVESDIWTQWDLFLTDINDPFLLTHDFD